MAQSEKQLGRLTHLRGAQRRSEDRRQWLAEKIREIEEEQRVLESEERALQIQLDNERSLDEAECVPVRYCNVRRKKNGRDGRKTVCVSRAYGPVLSEQQRARMRNKEKRERERDKPLAQFRFCRKAKRATRGMNILDLRDVALAIAEAGYAAIDVGSALERKLRFEQNELGVNGKIYPLADRRVYFVGVGATKNP